MAGNNDDLFLQYMLEMGALNPEEEKLARQQQYVDTLRSNALEPRRGQMVSGHYVAPSWTEYAAQLGNAYMARKGQKAVDAGQGAYNKNLIDRTAALRDQMARRRGGVAAAPMQGGKAVYNDDDMFAAPF